MESLAAPIVETTSIIDIQNDIALIDSVNNSFHQLSSLQHQTTDSIQSKIDNLTRQLDNIHSSIKSFKSSTQNKHIRNELKSFELEIFNSARSLTTLNMHLNTLKLSYNENLKQLDQLTSQLDDLQVTFLRNSADVDDVDAANIIKLKLFQSTGLKYDQNGEVIVLNKAGNSLKKLRLDDSYTEYFVSNFIWDNM